MSIKCQSICHSYGSTWYPDKGLMQDQLAALFLGEQVAASFLPPLPPSYRQCNSQDVHRNIHRIVGVWVGLGASYKEPDGSVLQPTHLPLEAPALPKAGRHAALGTGQQGLGGVPSVCRHASAVSELGCRLSVLVSGVYSAAPQLSV